MAARYTYFRTQDGGADRSPDKRWAPAALLAEIGKASTRTENGSISWPGETYHHYQVPLRSKVVILDPAGGELNDADAWSIVSNCVSKIAREAPGKAILPSTLLSAADRAAAAFYRKPWSPFVTVSSLSLATLPAQRIRIGNQTISAIEDREKYPIPTLALGSRPESTKGSLRGMNKYQLVKISTTGRSIHEAAANALDSFNLIRAIWSLFFTFRSWTVTFGPIPRKPLGVIHAGRIHTLHHPDGRPIEQELYWYDPEASDDRPVFDPGDKWPVVEENRLWAQRCLSRVPYSSDLKDLLVRYITALDHPDPQLAFLRMWSMLEKITDTIGGGYDQTIARTLWVYSAEVRPAAKDILEALRVARNRYIHSGVGDQQPDQIAYLIKSFVDPHLTRLLRNPFGAATISEYASHLSLPLDVNALKQRRAAITRAIAYAGRK